MSMILERRGLVREKFNLRTNDSVFSLYNPEGTQKNYWKLVRSRSSRARYRWTHQELCESTIVRQNQN